MDEVVEDGGVEDGGSLEFFAGDSGADDGEDSGADDGADAERGERDGAESFLEGVAGPLGVRDEAVDIFAGEELAGQGDGSGWD
jgi:hypothetical protein